MPPMSAEVLSGSRPARPITALIVCAVAVAGALGAAWFQVRDRLALGPPTEIPGTPLVVRPPRGWIQDPSNPSVFVQAVRVDVRGQEKWEVSRRIQFRYRRWPSFHPLLDLLRLNNYLDRMAAYQPEQSRIGPLPAVQVRRERRLQTPWGEERGETVYRLTCSGRGDEISVEYIPLGEITAGDIELLDEVCSAIQIDDPAFQHEGAYWQQRAGMSFSLDPDWRVDGPHLEEIPGLFVQGMSGDIPTWTVGVVRTWIAPGRTPEQLLRNFADTAWDEDGELTSLAEEGSERRVLHIRRTRESPGDGPLREAFLLSQADGAAVLLPVAAGSDLAGAASDAAGRIVRELKLSSSSLVPDLEAGQSAGRELVEQVLAQGPSRWWNATPARCELAGTMAGRPVRYITLRRNDPSGKGFSGGERLDWLDSGERITWEWTLQPDGRAYRLSTEHRTPTRGGVAAESRLEYLDERQNELVYQRGRGDDGSERRVRVGPAFVGVPLESVVERTVASYETGSWLIEASTRFGGTSSRWMRPLPADRAGNRRALLTDDFDPFGTVVAFDSDDEVAYQLGPLGRFERVAP